MPKKKTPQIVSESTKSEDTKTEAIIVTGKIIRNKVQIEGEEAAKLYEDGYYGLKAPKNSNTYLLDTFETSLLLERGRLQILDPTTQEIISPQVYIEKYSISHPGFWEQYIVYKDLRSRGYPVKAGVGRTIDFFVYPRGTKAETNPAKFFIHIVNESTPTTLTKLLQANQYSTQNKRKLVLAISDRTGGITYYEVTSFNLKEKKYSK